MRSVLNPYITPYFRIKLSVVSSPGTSAIQARHVSYFAKHLLSQESIVSVCCSWQDYSQCLCQTLSKMFESLCPRSLHMHSALVFYLCCNNYLHLF